VELAGLELLAAYQEKVALETLVSQEKALQTTIPPVQQLFAVHAHGSVNKRSFFCAELSGCPL
jgi:hypothetical protein